MTDTTEIIERDAKIFEAAVYEDKGVEVTEDDLDIIVANHTPVPIKVEHTDTPLVLGSLTKIWRIGKELFGKLAFTKPAWALVEASDARKLSVGLKKDKSALAEISVVRNPRVADAAVFAGAELLVFSADVSWVDAQADAATHTPDTTIPIPIPLEVTNMGELTPTPTNPVQVIDPVKAQQYLQTLAPGSPELQAISQFTASVTAMVAESSAGVSRAAEQAFTATTELQKMRTEQLILEYKKAGKILPKAEDSARAILSKLPLSAATFTEQETVTFKDKDGNEQSAHFAQMFLDFLNKMEPAISFKELARIEQEEEKLMPSGATEFYAKMGVDPNKAKQYL
jgi:hypothetical protein